MSVVDRAELLRPFAERLEQARIAAGKPSYGQLIQLSDERLKRATISDVLRGQTAPTIEFVVAFIEACQSHAAGAGIVPGPMLNLGAWREAWFELQRGLGVLRRLGPAAPGPDAHPLAVPRQLPPAPAPFVGRESELARLREAFGGRGSCMIIDGGAAVGKTSLVLHWAHAARQEYPDGDLYLNLRGYDPASSPMTVGRALALLLDSFNLPHRPSSDDIDACSALWRSLLAQRRLLVVLDNAAAAEQVRPLLPADCASAVVITSRRRLDSLVVRDGVRPMHLAAPSTRECRLLLEAMPESKIIFPDPETVDRLIRLCGNNPLALRIMADRAAGGEMSLDEIVEELSTRPRLAILATDDGDPTATVRSVLGWSYQALNQTDALALRSLAVHPGPRASAEAVAAIAAMPVPEARRCVRGLCENHLLDEPMPGIFEMHDLVRQFAADLPFDRHDDKAAAAATRRLLEWYLHTAAAADRILMPGRKSLVPAPPRPPVSPVVFTSYDAALAWCDDERANVIDVVALASRQAPEIAWRLPVILLSYFNLRKAWPEWIATFELALAASREVDSRYGQAQCLNALGIAFRETGRPGEAFIYGERAVAAFHDLDMPEGEAFALNNIGVIFNELNDIRALGYLHRAAAVAKSCGSRIAEATALHNLCEAYLTAGRFDDARACAFRTLAVCHSAGDRAGVGFALTSLGEIFTRLGRSTEAIRYLRAAIEVRREVGDVQGEATALLRLARALHERGDRDTHVHDVARRARAILESIGDPLAAVVRALQRRL